MSALAENILIFLQMADKDLSYIDSDGDIISLNYCDYPCPDGPIPVNVGFEYDSDNVKYLINGNIVIILITNENDLGERKYYSLIIETIYDDQYEINFDKTNVVSVMEITQHSFETSLFDKYHNSPGSMTKSVK